MADRADQSQWWWKGAASSLWKMRPRRSSLFDKLLADRMSLTSKTTCQLHFDRATERDYDLAIISLNLRESDGLRLCSQLRSFDRTRLLPILAIVDPVSSERLLRGLDLGVNDYLLRPLDRDELLARAKTQVRRKRFTDRLRDSVDLTMEMAIIDGLTGLHNRRYLERHLDTLLRQALARRTPLSLLLLDIDNFKAVNDTHGQDIGDNVLREFSDRVRRAIRGIDLAGRIGGEEFVVALPEHEQNARAPSR